MTQSPRRQSLQIKLASGDRFLPNTKSLSPSKLFQLNNSNPETKKERNSSTFLKESKTKNLQMKIAKVASFQRRRESLQVFDRLNLSPVHREGKSCQKAKMGFDEAVQKVQKTITLKPLPTLPESEDDLLTKLSEILEKLDPEKGALPLDLEDQKDYLIYRLCRRLRSLMQKPERPEETPVAPQREPEGPAQTKHGRFKIDVMNIHKRIEKSLSNIEMQLEKQEVQPSENSGENESFKENNEDPPNSRREQKSERKQSEHKQQKSDDFALEEKRKKILLKLTEEANRNLKPPNEQQEIMDWHQKLMDEPQKLSEQTPQVFDQPLELVEPQEKPLDQGQKFMEPQSKIIGQQPQTILEQTHSLSKFERPEANELNSLHFPNLLCDSQCQTESLPFYSENFVVKYPSDILASSLENVRRHQAFYERLNSENMAILNGTRNRVEEAQETQKFMDLPTKTVISRSPISPGIGTYKSYASPEKTNEDFLEEISEVMRTSRKEDLLRKIRNYGYLEKIESRYIEIIELINEKKEAGIRISSHYDLIAFLGNLINEITDIQKVYLDFKRQILNILLPGLPIYETKSAGEILSMISVLKSNDQLRRLPTPIDRSEILRKIYDEIGVFLESEDDLLRLLTGMTKDLNDLQYQCKLIAGMLEIDTTSDMRDILDATMMLLGNRENIPF